jgi:NitT/TauT family transport system ATP-binding protein
MSPRPGKVTDIIDVDLGSNRDEDTREDDRFYKKITEVREALRGSERLPGQSGARGVEDR